MKYDIKACGSVRTCNKHFTLDVQNTVKYGAIGTLFVQISNKSTWETFFNRIFAIFWWNGECWEQLWIFPQFLIAPAPYADGLDLSQNSVFHHLLWLLSSKQITFKISSRSWSVWIFDILRCLSLNLEIMKRLNFWHFEVSEFKPRNSEASEFLTFWGVWV